MINENIVRFVAFSIKKFLVQIYVLTFMRNKQKQIQIQVVHILTSGVFQLCYRYLMVDIFCKSTTLSSCMLAHIMGIQILLILTRLHTRCGHDYDRKNDINYKPHIMQ